MSTVRLAFIGDNDEPWREIGVAGPDARGRRFASVLVVPGAQIFTRWMNVGGSTPAQLRAAALAALAPDLAQPASTCVATIGEPQGDKRLVCIAARADVECWLAAARARGFTPDLVTPDVALLPPPHEGVVIAARRGAEIVVRGADFGFTCQDDLLDALLPGRTFDERDFEAEAVRVVRAGKLAALPDFARALPSQHDANAKSFPLARIAAAAGVALVLGAAAPWVHAMRLDAAAKDFRREAEQIARTALPGASRIVNPRAQLEEALLPLRGGDRLLAAAAAIVEGASASPQVAIARLDASIETGVTASLTMSTMSDLDPLRSALAAQGLQITERPGPASASRASADIIVRPQP